MRYYFAPLEGITDSVFREIHHRYFPSVDRYYTPFFSPTIHRKLTPKEKRELPVADSVDFCVVPQLLTKNPEDFLWMAQVCADRGYTEVNLNLGCPSGTVTAKGKGSGMLRDPDSLNKFLDDIYSATPLDISIKTRIGFYERDEFPALVEIFNQYPVKELIVHPRVRNAFYNSDVDIDMFSYAFNHSKVPLCYNGDITALEQVSALPAVDAVMIGRGLLADPGLLCNEDTTLEKLEEFYNALFDGYIQTFGSARNAMFRLKEHWRYLLERLDGAEKLGKQLRKTTDLNEYKQITHQIFSECQFKH